MPRGEGERARVGLERLDENESGRVPPASPGELGDELERPLLGPEVGQRESSVGIDDGGELDAGEVVALGDHLRADEHRPVGSSEPRQRVAEGPRPLRCVSVQPDPLQLRHAAGELAFESLGARADADELGRPARRARRERGLVAAAVVAAQALVPVQGQGDIAQRAPARPAARAAVERRRDTAPVEEENRLAPRSARRPSSFSSGADSG